MDSNNHSQMLAEKREQKAQDEKSTQLAEIEKLSAMTDAELEDYYTQAKSQSESNSFLKRVFTGQGKSDFDTYSLASNERNKRLDAKNNTVLEQNTNVADSVKALYDYFHSDSASHSVDTGKADDISTYFSDEMVSDMKNQMANSLLRPEQAQSYSDYIAMAEAYQALKNMGYDPASLIQTYDRNQNAVEDEQTKAYANEHGVKASLETIPQNIASGLGGTTATLNSWLMGTPLDSQANAFDYTRKVQTTRGQVGENIRTDENGNETLGGKIGGFLYDTGMGLADTGANMALAMGNPLAMGALMGTQAGASSAYDVASRGGTVNQMAATGLASALAEGISEAISLGNLKSLKTVAKSGGKGLLEAMGKQALVEGTEEGTSELLNKVADFLINKDLSASETQYRQLIESGMSEEEAREKVNQSIFNDIVKSIGMGAISGGVFGAGANILGNATNTTQTIPVLEKTEVQHETQAEIPVLKATQEQAQIGAETTDTANLQPMQETSLEKAEKGSGEVTVNAGKATTIKQPYTGKVPVKMVENTVRVNVSQDAFDRAIQNIEKASAESTSTNKGIKTILAKIYEGIFEPGNTSKTVVVDGLQYNGNPYVVTVNKSAVSKLMSDPNLSAQKIAVLDCIDDVIKNANYVGSGVYSAHTARKQNAIRYDYFETDANINGQNYVVTVDVAVLPDTNNYRTHKVINEINLTQSAKSGPMPGADSQLSTVTGPMPAVSVAQSSLFNNSITNSNQTVNRAPVLEQKAKEPREIPFLRETALEKAQKEGDAIGESVVDEAEEHTPEQLRVMQEYKSNQDSSILTYFDRVMSGLKAMKFKPVAKTSDVVAEFVSRELGIDIRDSEIGFNHSAVKHIVDDHMSGKGKSPLSEEDLCRIKYVLENPDELVSTGETTTATRMADGSYAPKIAMRKRIDGHYYVVEAVTNAKTKQNVVVTAFVEKVGHETPKYKDLFSKSYRVPNAPANASPSANARNEHDIDSMSSILNSTETVNGAELRKRSYNDTIVHKTDMPEVIKNEFISNPQMYEVLKNKTTQEQAQSLMDNLGTDEAFVQFNRLADAKNPVSVPMGRLLAQRLNAEGRTDMAVEVLRTMSTKLTEAGQFTQAAAIALMDSDPVMALQYVTRDMDSLNKKGREKFGDKWTDFELTEAEKETFSKIEVGDTEAIKKAYEGIYNRIRKQYPSTMMEKLTEYRRVAMLLNTRTNVRNIVSNAMLLPVRWTSDRISALGQSVIHLVDSEYQQTQALAVGKESKKLAHDAWETVKEVMLGDEGKYEDSTQAVRDKQVFKGSKFASYIDNVTNGAITRANNAMGKDIDPSMMETARNLTYFLLKKGDDVFVQKNFEQRLASYIEAQGITSVEDIPADAITLAQQEALKATFKDDTALARTLTGIKKNTGIFGEALLPFTKTPANLAMRGYDYSIGGYIDMFKTLVNKNRTQADVSNAMDNLAKSLLGTAGIYAGYLLAKSGIITGALSDDDEEQAFQKKMGMLPFAIKVGDNYYTYDWAQPASIPIILGASIYQSMEESDNLLNTWSQAGMAAVDAWFNLSPVQNLQNIFGGYGTISENILGTLADMPASLIPAQLGALTRVGDTTQRLTYSNGDFWGSRIDSIKSKIPVLSETLPASYDTWGNEIKRSDTTAEAAFAQLISPGQLGNSNVTQIDDEIMRLYQSTGNNGVFPLKADWSYKINGLEVPLDNVSYSLMQQSMGESAYELAETFINSSGYSDLGDETKAKVLSDLYSFARALAKSKQLGYDIANGSEKTLYQIYLQGGAQSVVNYKIYKLQADANGNGSVSAEEAETYLRGRSGMPKSERAYWFDTLNGSKNNPFK